MNALIFFIAVQVIKYLIKEYSGDKLQRNPIEYRVNNKAIKSNWQQGHYHLGYYHQLLNIPKKTLCISDRVVEDYYRLSLAPDKDMTQAAVADKQAARLYLLDRIHYLHSLN